MLRIDLHTHSIASGHALNTVYEMALAASRVGVTHLGITDHGPSMKGAAHPEYFWISDQLKELHEVQLFLGIEANILNDTGELDLPEELLRKQRIVMAGLHELTPFRTGGRVYNTRALINAMQNPFVQIISHPYRPEFPVVVEDIVEESVRTGTVLELNNSLFSRSSSRVEIISVYGNMIKCCRKNNVKLLVGSDAHVAANIGNDAAILSAMPEIGLTADMVLNNFPDELERMLLKE